MFVRDPHRTCREIPYLGIVTSLLYSPDVSCPLRAKSGNTEHSMSALPPKADIDHTTGIPQKFAQHVRSEIAVYRRIVKQAGIPLQ